MTPPIRPEKPKNAIQAMRENLDILREEGATPEEIEREIRKWGRVIQNINDREQAATPQDVGEAMAPALSSAFDAGTFGLAGIATDALSPGDFRTNRDMRQKAYSEMPTSDRILSSVAGGLANPVARFVRPAAGGAGVFAKAGRGALEGALQGAATGFGENVGTTSGAREGTLAGALIGGGLGAAAAPAMAGAARFLERPSGLAGSQMDLMIPPLDKYGEAAVRRSQRITTTDGGLAPTPRRGTGRPEPMAVDVAGPQAMAELRGATGTVGGREAFRRPFDAREAQMPSAVTQGTPDAVALENQLRAARSVRGRENFGAAVAETKGQPVESDVISELMQTPMGAKAWRDIQERRPNIVFGQNDPARALPSVPKGMPEGAVPVEGLEPTALNAIPAATPKQTVVPDAEAVHEMKQLLAEWGRLDPEVARASGIDAKGAQAALEGFGRVREELAPPFASADAQYAEDSGLLDAVRLGRSPWKNNPSAQSERAGKLATTNVLDRFAMMTPEEQALLRSSKQYDIATRVREGTVTPQKAARKMAKPGSALARELSMAGGDIGPRLQAWADPLERQAAILPKGQISVEPETSSLLAGIADRVAPTLPWMVAKSARHAAGGSSTANVARRGLEDAELGRLWTQSPETLAEVLGRMAREDESVGLARRAGAGAAGGVGGSKKRATP
jgi:hypothetical protein